MAAVMPQNSAGRSVSLHQDSPSRTSTTRRIINSKFLVAERRCPRAASLDRTGFHFTLHREGFDSHQLEVIALAAQSRARASNNSTSRELRVIEAARSNST